MPKKLEFDVAKASHLYSSGMGCPEVGRALGVHRNTLHRRLVLAGVKMRSRHEARTGQEIDYVAIFELYQSGMKVKAIARRLKTTRDVVTGELDRRGIIRPKVQSRIDTAKVIALYASGVGGKKLAEMIGCSDTLIYYHIRKAGMSPRTPEEASFLRCLPESTKKRNRYVRTIEREYGLTSDKFDALFTLQLGACAICRRKFTDHIAQRPHVDHNHETEEVRGLLCRNCNTALGLTKDNPKTLRAAIAYLEFPPAFEV